MAQETASSQAAAISHRAVIVHAQTTSLTASPVISRASRRATVRTTDRRAAISHVRKVISRASRVDIAAIMAHVHSRAVTANSIQPVTIQMPNTA